MKNFINVFSTPRTGSTWYSLFQKHLLEQKLKQEVVFLSEPFNPLHFNMYHEVTSSGLILNHREFVKGSFYKKYELENEAIIVKKIYEEKKQTMSEEFDSRLQCLEKTISPVVVHNHISPLEEKYYLKLLELSTENYMIIRRDLRQQLASYAIAFHTKQFVSFGRKNSEETFENSIIVLDVLKNLCRRIQFQVQETKRNADLFKLVIYEEMDFIDFEKSPQKQNANAWGRLISTDQKIIEQLLLAEFQSFTFPD